MNLPKCNLDFLLTEEMIKKASSIFDIDEATLRRLNDMALLNVEYIRNAIVIWDFERLTKGLTYLADLNQTYTFKDVKLAIAKKYNLSPTLVSRLVVNKATKYRSRLFYCKECGVIMTETECNRTGGICSNCFANNIVV